MTPSRQKPCVCGGSKTPTFNYTGVKPGVCCSKCQLPGMENVKDRRCVCEKRCIKPVFNFPGKKIGSHCNDCKLPGMENVVQKRCGCGKRAISPKFNFPGNYPGTHCAICKLPGMENVIHKRCGCERRISNPNFNYPDKKVGICCDACKLGGMVNVVSKKCKCGVSVGFGFPGGKKECCVKCKRPGMIDLIHVNVLCKCGVRAGFGLPDGDTECCKACKTEDMVDLAHVVGMCGCGSGSRRIYSNDNGATMFCSSCRTPDMRNITVRRCPGYDGVECPNDAVCHYGYCVQCDPDDTRRLTHKRYEQAFFDYLKDYINPIREYWVNTPTGKYRIDGIITNGNNILCIEVDEYAHKAPGYEDDTVRQDSITETFSGTYDTVAWVRVNPNCERKLTNGDYDAYVKIQEETSKSRHLLAKDAILRLIENPSTTTVLVY